MIICRLMCVVGNDQGREVLLYPLIDEATWFHVTHILPSRSARDLYEAILTAWVKWAELHVCCWWTLTDRSWLDSSLNSWEHKVPPFVWELQKRHGPMVFWERHGACVRSMVEKMVHDRVPDDMSAQSLFDRGDIS